MWNIFGQFEPKLWTILDTLGPWGGEFAPKASPLTTGLQIMECSGHFGTMGRGGDWVVFTSLKSALIVMLLRTHFQCLMEDVTQDTGVVIVVVVVVIPSFFSRHF